MQKVSPWGFVGMGALACLLFLVVAGIAISPWWAVAVMLLVWLVLFARACRCFESAPTGVVRLAAVGFVLWAVVQVVGGLWLW